MFAWLEPTATAPTSSARARVSALRRELGHRAALLYRLGYTPDDAARRLAANLAWEYDPPGRDGAHRRPDDLDDAASADVIATTYARRPSD